jgi:hypothetical protein
MPVAYLNQGVRKDLTEAKRMNEVKSEAEGVRVSAANDSETEERTPLSPP